MDIRWKHNTRQMACLIVNMQFITSNVFSTGTWAVEKETFMTGEVLFWFNICFFFYFCIFWRNWLICKFALFLFKLCYCIFNSLSWFNLTICFNLRFRNMFRKFIISLLNCSNSVFETLLQIFLWFNFLSIWPNLISVKVLMILMLPSNSREFYY